jgi:hypothetical protein
MTRAFSFQYCFNLCIHSPWFQTIRSYVPAANLTLLNAETNDVEYSLGNIIACGSLVRRNNFYFDYDNTIYVVFSSSDVTFVNQYNEVSACNCGDRAASYPEYGIFTVHIPELVNPLMQTCSIIDPIVTPNGIPSVDSMIRHLAAQIADIFVYPFVRFTRSNSISDQCKWTLGNVCSQANGAKFNMKMPGSNGRSYLVTPLWNATRRACENRAAIIGSACSVIDLCASRGACFNRELVMNSALTVYPIWYGGQIKDTSKTIISTFLSRVNNSNWFNTVREYAPLANVTKGPEYSDIGYSQGKSLDINQIASIAAKIIGKSGIKPSEQAIYFLFTSADVKLRWDKYYAGTVMAAACTMAFSSEVGGVSMKFVLVPQFTSNQRFNCVPADTRIGGNINFQQTPNNDTTADDMVPWIAKHLADLITNPKGRAVSTLGDINAPGLNCMNYFGTGCPVSKGNNAAFYNSMMGPFKYMLPALWSERRQACVNQSVPAVSSLCRANIGCKDIDLCYRGGDVMNWQVSVRPIWYGTWSDRGKQIIRDFVNGISSNRWFDTVKAILPNASLKMSPEEYNVGSFLGADLDFFSAGERITENVIANFNAPADPSVIYLVLTSEDIDFAAVGEACAYHHYKLVQGVNIKYSFVPQGLAYCSSINTKASSNGIRSVDGIINFVAHELVETITNPISNGWINGFAFNNENADYCEWNFGKVCKSPNDFEYNIVIGERKYLIQTNYDPRVKGCTNPGFPAKCL